MKKEDKNILYTTGQLDCLSYYKRVFRKKRKFLKNFIENKEIATKIYIQEDNFYLVKRGSKEEPLYFSELKIEDRLFSLRKADDLDDVREKVSKKEEKIWHYFVPRKVIEMHYATNNEKQSKLDRIFIDIDEGENFSENQARKVVLKLIEEIKKDNGFRDLLRTKGIKKKPKIQVLWTGSGFHVYILLKGKVNHNFYRKYFSWNKENQSFIEKWAKSVSEKLNYRVEAGHERKKDKIILDTSATPSGKLARCPYSLNLDDKGKIIGICVPLKEKDLKKKGIIKELKNLNLKKAIKEY